jgi:hypothetical protein
VKESEEALMKLARPVDRQHHRFEALVCCISPWTFAPQVHKTYSCIGGVGIVRHGQIAVDMVRAIAMEDFVLFGDLPPQLHDLSLHLRIARALADALEVVFDLAFQIESLASRTSLERFLDDIAAKLFARVSILLSRCARESPPTTPRIHATTATAHELERVCAYLLLPAFIAGSLDRSLLSLRIIFGLLFWRVPDLGLVVEAS